MSFLDLFLIMLPQTLNPSDMLKRYKAAEPEEQPEVVLQSNGKGKGRAVTVEDDEDERMDYAQGGYRDDASPCSRTHGHAYE